MNTDRLYYNDAYLTDFRAQVTEAREDGRRIYLDRTAFYPASGGQPFDLGAINGIPVTEIVDEEDRIAHLLAEPLTPAAHVDGRIDWARRFDHMQQHTGQHLLSAVLEELFHLKTLSFHLGAEASTIDLETGSLSPTQIAAAERRANELVFSNRPVRVSYEHAGSAEGLRKATERTGTLRIVAIDGLDRSACGGTHVRATGEIGPILLRKTEKIRGNVRLEFLCGLRAVRRARADFDALNRVALVFSVGLDDAAGMVASQQSRLAAAEKQRAKLSGELALRRGRDLYAAAAPGADGLRVHQAAIPSIDDDVRQEAQGFTSGAQALYAAFSDSPAALLIACSADSGIHAGNTVKQIVTALGGRGGGSPQIAQGSLPDRAAVAAARDALAHLLANR